jgi:hypothetical protein
LVSFRRLRRLINLVPDYLWRTRGRPLLGGMPAARDRVGGPTLDAGKEFGGVGEGGLIDSP